MVSNHLLVTMYKNNIKMAAILPYFLKIKKVSEWVIVVLMPNEKLCSATSFGEMIISLFALDQHTDLDFYSGSYRF